MTFRFEPAAQAELLDAVTWYETQQPGLGEEFFAEVESALKRAQANPEHFPKVRGARKIRLQRFRKYSILFAVKNDVVGVVAVFHGARNPDELKRRLR
ncbi:MAG: type II toxin-antitoxin system RelE/ParE family toxin [Verrucomicrobia bacterium]|nr:type II toxin-antitoxin system RelE/ParE family toxin [Verrucomicrobiota bacterium]